MATASTLLQILFMFTAMLFHCLAANSNANCIKTERDALLKLKHGLSDPNNMLPSWVGEDCCAWKGVICSNKTNHVVKLDLHNEESCLGGEISLSLLGLQNLEFLDLSMNCFYDIRIPKFLGSLDSLKYLNLSYAKFSGVVPHHLGNLSSLQILDLKWNSLEVDNFHWISTLSSLQHLDLSGVTAASSSKWLDAINMLPSLEELYLSNCNLTSIPPFFQHVNFTSLRVLNLNNNWLNSAVPSWIFNLISLEHLDLSYNYFHGVIPGQIGTQSSLTFLDISSNLFHGAIRETLGNLCNLQELHLGDNFFSGEIGVLFGNASNCIQKSLKQLYVEYNSLHGSLPAFLWQFRQLESIDLFSNFLTGPIPTSIGNLSCLRYFDVSNNSLTGKIPESFGQLANLEYLDVSDNVLDGVVSEHHFASLRSLRYLFMEFNPLQFHIDPTWVPPFQLEVIYLSSCKVGPEFPQWLKFQKKIYYLDMSISSISGSIPDWFRAFLPVFSCWI